jgi:hypothetical protein
MSIVEKQRAVSATRNAVTVLPNVKNEQLQFVTLNSNRVRDAMTEKGL